ncbi:hypothetical protein M5K25_019075 [Dendrobium thyrsiflorum]|uniref:Uncharacterized protein n=1 Tax=Dendrobium thyrsiflorum TaxID=117978 RepID=A0ABD0UKW0_DENTH
MEGQVLDLHETAKKILENNQTAALEARGPVGRNTNSEIRRRENDVEIIKEKRGRYEERHGYGGHELRGADWERKEGDYRRRGADFERRRGEIEERNGSIESSLESYNEAFDIVFLNDASMDGIFDLVTELCSSQG